MPTAPYLLVCFAVSEGTPGGDAILDALGHGAPWGASPPVALGVPHVYLTQVTDANMYGRLDEFHNYFSGADTQYGGVVRWVVQLCESADITEG